MTVPTNTWSEESIKITGISWGNGITKHYTNNYLVVSCKPMRTAIQEVTNYVTCFGTYHATLICHSNANVMERIVKISKTLF